MTMDATTVQYTKILTTIFFYIHIKETENVLY